MHLTERSSRNNRFSASKGLTQILLSGKGLNGNLLSILFPWFFFYFKEIKTQIFFQKKVEILLCIFGYVLMLKFQHEVGFGK